MKTLTSIRILIFACFLILLGFVYLTTTKSKDNQVKLILEQHIEDLENSYNVSQSHFQLFSNSIYSLIINKPQILKLVYKAKHSSGKLEQAELRTRLQYIMEPYFMDLNKAGVNIILFSFENNKVFLRVHKPNKYDDDLSQIRYSFKYVNDTKNALHGFEQGKVSHAFRNVLPLHYKGEYLGSVDVSFSSEILQENTTSLHGIDTHFIVNKSIFTTKIWESKKQVKYSQSIEHQDFLFSSTLSHPSFDQHKIKLNRDLKDEINTNIKHTNAFSLYHKGENVVKIITFFPIKNIQDKKTVAYLVSYSDSPYIANLLNRYKSINIIFFIGLVILAFVIYYNIKQRYNLQEKVKEEVAKNRKQDKIQLEKFEIIQNKLNMSLMAFGDNVIASDSDTKGVITYVSVALCEISGYSNDELIGQPHSVLRHPDTEKKLFEGMWHDLKQEKIWRGEIKNLKKDGGFYWVRATISPKYNEHKELIGYSAIRHDITPEKVKEEFLANMSHELRTPLNSIIGFSGILQEKLQDGENKELSKLVEASSKHLLTLINDILDLSKMNSAEFTIEPHEFNAYSEINNFSKRFDGLSKKNLVCSSNVSENLNAIFLGDWLRLSQIVLNLISNSMKFTGIGGRVTFDSEYVKGSIIFKISDNGIGMSQETQDKIFKPFTQADGSTTRKYGGTGLGLSITQKLVEAMNGKMKLESELDVGTTFTITIPLKKISDDIDTKEIAEVVKKERITFNSHILVVEDNTMNQIVLRMHLKKFSVTCDIANDGLEAVDIYNPEIHKLILMDENMPNMNGIEAMKIIKEKYKGKLTPIIALTANTMVGDKERFLSQGMDGYLSKPIDIEELSQALEEFL